MVPAAFVPSPGQDLFCHLEKVEPLRPVKVPDVCHQWLSKTIVIDQFLQGVFGAPKVT